MNGAAHAAAAIALALALAACSERPSADGAASAERAASGLASASAPASAPASASPASASATASASPASASAPASASPASASATASAPAAAPLSTLLSTPIAVDASRLPFYFTASFDGSQRFTGWIDSLRFARELAKASSKQVHFTYFINSVYFDTAKVPSTIGRAQTRSEIAVRRALAQIAVNEGHEIASHGVGHFDGTTWTLAQWREELEAFHAVADGLIYVPVRDAAGRATFPRFSPRADAVAGEAGSACVTDADCHAMRCADLGDAGRLCAPPCNLRKKCGSGSVCGSPFFREDEDVCLPPPDLPVVVDGVTLFDARGTPHLHGTGLEPLAIRGFRAPFLGANDALVAALLERGYRYDTSFAAAPGPPRTLATRRNGPALTELGLAVWPGALTIPMDYNYMQLKASGERMQADYRASLVASFQAGKVPFNIGHHFAQWEGGAYARALEDAVRYAAAECPDDAGEKRCPGAVVASFREVESALRPE